MKQIFNKILVVPKVVWIVLLVLIAARLLLPIGMKYTINWYLDKKLVAYQGHIEDFDLELYRGAYQIQGLKIWKRTSNEDNPLVSIGQLDLSLAWRALLDRKLLGDLEVDQLKLILTDSDNEKKKSVGSGEDWKSLVGRLIPIELESFKMKRSEVHLVNRDFKVPVDVVLDGINITALNIKNTDDKKELLPSSVTAHARFQRNAAVEAQAKINLLSDLPAFEAKAQLEKLDVTKLNDFFLAYGPFTFTKGQFSIYTEISTKNNRVVGYVKPFFENLDVISDHEHFDNPKRFFNEVGLAMANLVLRNRKEKSVATKIEFEGAAMAPDIDKWGAFWGSVRNGFVEALKRTVEGTISIKDVPETKK